MINTTAFKPLCAVRCFLELLLTKLKFCGPGIQIVAMSATLPQLDRVAAWLGASVFVSQFRPVALDEHAVIQSKVFDKSEQLVSEGLPSSQATNSPTNLCLLMVNPIAG